MKEYKNTSPVFADAIQIVETTDPAHADNINMAPTQLLQNTLSNRGLIEKMLAYSYDSDRGRVDEETVDDKNYTVTSGSTVITLKAGFLGTLANGKHRLTVLYLDGETSAVFEILPKSSGSDLDKPTGGDSSGDPSDKPSGGDSSGDPSGEKITRKPSDSIPSTSVRTGDEERPLRWLVCLLSSFACVSGTIFYRRKKKSLTS